MDTQVILLLQLLFIGGVVSHSWITCTDYLQENGDYWSSAYCRAFAREGYKYTKKDQFGVDTGYNFNEMSEDRSCKTARSDMSAYNSEYPMAVYYPGQKVVITHPTKNHVAAPCTNQYIPDNGNFIYRSSVNPSIDPKLSEFRRNVVADLGVSPFGHTRTQSELTTYPKPGYQNAPKFCENMDKALATYAFYIPDLPAGRYTFMWEWTFNSAAEKYSSCWEADVVSSKSQRDSRLSKANLPTKEPELLHGKSLAPAPVGGQPATQSPPQVTQPERPRWTYPPRPTQPPVRQRTTATNPFPMPAVGGNSGSTTQCLDTCLKQCYSCN